MSTRFPWSRQTWELLALLLVITGAVFFPVVRTSFINLDDGIYAAYNPQVQGGLSWGNFCWAWNPNNGMGLWVPMTWVSLEVDGTVTRGLRLDTGNNLVLSHSQRVEGQPPPFGNAIVYKVHNWILHMAAAGLLFAFLFRTTGQKWAAFAAALLWAVHPLRVESVAWVTERKDVLAAMLGLLGMNFYLLWVERKRVGWYVAMLVAIGGSLLAKPLFVTAPLLLLVVDFWPLGRMQNGRLFWKWVLEKWPLFLMAVGVAVMSVYTQSITGAMVSAADLPLGLRLEHVAVSYVIYLQQQFEPWGLGVFYPYDQMPAAWDVAVSLAVLCGVTALAVWQRKRQPWLLSGWLWFVGTLVPMIGFVQAGQQGYADRFTYFPAMGFFLMVVYAAAHLVQRRQKYAQVVWGVFVAAVILLSGLTLVQIGFWKSDIDLYQHTLAVTGKNLNVRMMLSAAYLREGAYENAADNYREVAAEWPGLAPGWLLGGYLDLQLGHFDRAARELAGAIPLRPRDGRLRYLFGSALAGMGRREEAREQLELAVKLDPNNEAARRELEALAR